ncbi:hypothetical protein [Haloplasma contractile]
MGGNRDLPNDFEWYYFEGESQLDGTVKSRPLSFLAQFNSEELN